MSDIGFDGLYREAFAPVVISFAKWALRAAASDGYGELYFLARDMYPVYIAALKLREKDGTLPEPKYIYVSRYALRRAEYALLGEEALRHICLNGINVTFRVLMQRAALSDAEAERVAADTGYADRMDKRLDRNELYELKHTLWGVESFRKPFKRYADEAFMPARGYLWESGIFKDNSVAICDSGWVGSIQQSIAAISGAQVKGYYLGLYEIPRRAKRDAYETWLFAPEGGIGIKERFSNCLFEAVISAPTAMTVGYEMYEIGRYRPVAEREVNPNSDRMKAAGEIIENETVKLCGEDIAKTAGVAEDVCANMLRVMSEPTAEEAEILGTFLFCDDVVGSASREVAALFDKREFSDQMIVRRTVKKLLGKNTAESGWLEGSVVRSDASAVSKRRALRDIRIYKKLMYLRKKCISRLHSIFS